MNLLNLWNAASGTRTYYVCAAYAVVVLLACVGVLDESTAKTLENLLVAAGGVALRDAIAKLKKTMSPSATNDGPTPPGEEVPPGMVLPFSSASKVGLILLAIWCLSQRGHGQDRPTVPTSMQLSAETRSWYRNPDGSCVQCSIGMAGVHGNDLNAASLLWDTEYGPAVRGGSWPSRVEAYCDRRGIKAWSVTANTVDETLPWMVWAARTGRFAAIGAGQAHFQTLYGYDPLSERPWMVCNNNSTHRIDRYGEAEFKRLHAASGPWVVILERASSDPPSLVKWWR